MIWGETPLFLEISIYQVYRGLYNPVPKKDSSRPLQGSQQEPMSISWFMSGFCALLISMLESYMNFGILSSQQEPPLKKVVQGPWGLGVASDLSFSCFLNNNPMQVLRKRLSWCSGGKGFFFKFLGSR